MSFAIRTMLLNVKSYLAAQGWFDDVVVGEPAAPPSGGGFSASVFMASAGISYLTRDTTAQTHTVTVRIYRNVLEQPGEDAEIEMSDVVSTLITAAIGHFDLTNTVASLEVHSIDVTWDDNDVGGIACRTADIDLPLTYREAA